VRSDNIQFLQRVDIGREVMCVSRMLRRAGGAGGQDTNVNVWGWAGNPPSQFAGSGSFWQPGSVIAFMTQKMTWWRRFAAAFGVTRGLKDN
jgi:hypothetical protein